MWVIEASCANTKTVVITSFNAPSSLHSLRAVSFSVNNKNNYCKCLLYFINTIFSLCGRLTSLKNFSLLIINL